MKTKLIAIGNSKGVRIPAAMIREAGLEYELDLRVEQDGLKIRPARHLREGWDDAFAAAAGESADALLIDDTLANDFDEQAWQW
ncbi:AbrB/MazE/SpoVT family DNA-binding domain-containing protein [Wenzhouxiangella limi]|uniref:AbrB/MazE/SpoVT family DNA-binding domain-containing protein n=1 Tax=Wenzhouxiangella limi TaxID=2707351 RepID=A0A845VIX8_9GAMM|nr:AbrB/MazE/SpoVT family DNA-binding domain-containing protein [Wenzhouxiangella limi]NDY97129.1 AbrB/MazE/SpoVT family DNA-binding domain-containing protein [Wenzhouxiangella limi]